MPNTTIEDREFTPEISEQFRKLYRVSEPPKTFGDWITLVQQTTSAGSISIADLCHTNSSPHFAETADGTYQFRCTLDGFALTGLLNEPVTIHTVSPVSDQEITIRANDTTVHTNPESVVISFAIAAKIPEYDEFSPEQVYQALCPHIYAFSSQSEYEQWNDQQFDALMMPITANEALNLWREIV